MVFTLTLDSVFSFIVNFLLCLVITAIIVIPLVAFYVWLQDQRIKSKIRKELKGGKILDGIQEESSRTPPTTSADTTERYKTLPRINGSGEAQTREHISSEYKSNDTPTRNVGKIKFH